MSYKDKTLTSKKQKSKQLIKFYLTITLPTVVAVNKVSARLGIFVKENQKFLLKDK